MDQHITMLLECPERSRLQQVLGEAIGVASQAKREDREPLRLVLKAARPFRIILPCISAKRSKQKQGGEWKVAAWFQHPY